MVNTSALLATFLYFTYVQEVDVAVMILYQYIENSTSKLKNQVTG